MHFEKCFITSKVWMGIWMMCDHTFNNRKIIETILWQMWNESSEINIQKANQQTICLVKPIKTYSKNSIQFE
jgi:hypothetical protein